MTAVKRCVVVCCFLYVFLSLAVPEMFFIELRDARAQEIINRVHQKVPGNKKVVTFYEDWSLLAFLFYAGVAYSDGKVVLSPRFLHNDYLDVIVAHELGHIYLDNFRVETQKSELDAMFFAASICGTERVINFVRGIDYRYEEEVVQELRAREKLQAGEKVETTRAQPK